MIGALETVSRLETGVVDVHSNLKPYVDQYGYVFDLPTLAFVDHLGRIAIGDTLYSLAGVKVIAESITTGSEKTYDLRALKMEYGATPEAAGKVMATDVEWSPIYVSYYGTLHDGYVRMENKTYTKWSFGTRYLADGNTQIRICNTANCPEGDGYTYLANAAGFTSSDVYVRLYTYIYNSCSTPYYTEDWDYSDTSVTVTRDRCSGTGAYSDHTAIINGTYWVQDERVN